MDVPGSIGECCAGQFCKGRNLQLRNCHKCAECNGIVHMICGEPVQGADLVTCFKCLADTKPKSTSESINRQMIVCAAGDRCRCPSQCLGVDIDICDVCDKMGHKQCFVTTSDCDSICILCNDTTGDDNSHDLMPNKLINSATSMSSISSSSSKTKKHQVRFY